MIRRTLFPLLALCLALPGPWSPEPALAQESAEREEPARVLRAGGVELSVLAGALAPVSRLSERAESFGTELTASGLLALDGIYWVGSRVGIAARGAYAPATVSVIPGGLAGAVPEDLGPADYWTVSAEARLRFEPPGEGIALTPYLSAGAGLRMLDVRALAGPEVEDSSDPLLTLAAGVGLPLGGPVDLKFELREHLTFYESPAGQSRLQNELAALVGGSIAVR